MNIRKFEDNRRIGERLNDMLSRRWKQAIALFVTVIAIMAGILVLDSYLKNQKIASAELTEDIQDAFSEWVDQEPEERVDDELDSLIEKAFVEYPKGFASQRALFTRAQMEYEKENWSKAAESFTEFASKWEESYLAPSSLFNAASAYEESGSIEEAENALTRLVERYGDMSPQTSEALFSLGRLAESQNNIEEALEKYRELVSRFPDSRWHNLAKSRILYIES